ncbi:MAG: glycosyltransferase family 4 protein [Desulfobacteraceae bacterium]|nr:glycosyltransferase family 4 protein [Desulfobacteraceae bacterium]
MIDGYNLSLEKGTGIATYSRNLSYNLEALDYSVNVLYGTHSSPSLHPLIQEISFFDSRIGKESKWKKKIKRIKQALQSPFGLNAYEVPITGAVITDTFKSRLPYFDKIYNVPQLFILAKRHFKKFKKFLTVRLPSRPDIAHWTYPIPLRIAGAKNIYTLHDLVPLRLPYTTLDYKKNYLKILRCIVKNADHICTVSKCSKQDIINLLGVKEQNITNTYQSVEIPQKYLKKPISDIKSEIEGTFGLDYKKFFLFFGAIEPKKNIDRLIQAYLSSSVDIPLVIAGPKAWKSEEELRLLFDDHIRWLVQKNGETRVKRKIIQLNYVPFPLLISLIRCARSVLFPSLYEGFGLPVLEAMLCGTPVMTSKRGSTPEIAGDAAVLVDPYNVREIRDAIKQLSIDESLCKKLSHIGPKHIEYFSPDHYQKRLDSMYSSIV